MVEISSSGSGGGPGWATAPGYPTRKKADKPDDQQDKQMGLPHDEPTGSVIGAAIEAHKALGPGFSDRPDQVFLASWLPQGPPFQGSTREPGSPGLAAP